MKKTLLTVLFTVFFLLKNAQNTNLVFIENKGLSNGYQLNDLIFRSAQPTKKSIKSIEQLGVKTIINLRTRNTDKKFKEMTSLKLIQVPINPFKMDYEDIVQALRTINTSPKPILIHCLHGSDRTGAIMAAYRMVFENWTKEDAMKEMTIKQLGFHTKWFPNIYTLIDTLDVNQLRKDID